MKHKKAFLAVMSVGVLTLTSCTTEMMGSMSNEFRPFGKATQNTKELKSQALTPDDSLKMQGVK